MEQFEKESCEKFFNFSKNSKEDPPITSFLEFFAYKVEERKHILRFPAEYEEN